MLAQTQTAFHLLAYTCEYARTTSHPALAQLRVSLDTKAESPNERRRKAAAAATRRTGTARAMASTILVSCRPIAASA